MAKAILGTEEVRLPHNLLNGLFPEGSNAYWLIGKTGAETFDTLRQLSSLRTFGGYIDNLLRAACTNPKDTWVVNSL